MSVPDPLGRDRLAAGAAMYKVPVHGVKPPPPPFYRQPRFIALFVIVGLLGSYLLYRGLSGAEDTPEAAATRVVELFLDEEYAQMRNKLCRADREQVGTNDLETAGRSAEPLMKTLDHPEVTGVTDVVLKGEFAGLPAKQVSGRIVGKVGSGTTFAVVTVDQQGGWRVCLSPGGYAVAALGLEVPIGGALEEVDP